MRSNYDLIVIGGGPAGSSAAITAARAGIRVLMLERGHFPRHKVCGEFVSAESISLLNWLLGEEDPGLVPSSLPLTEARLLIDGRILRIPMAPAAASIARYDLDLALWNAARRAGAEVLSQTAVQNIEGQGPFVVHTPEGDFHARSVINASGRWSNLNRAETPDAGSSWLGIKTHMRGEGAPSVDLYFFVGGYCGVQPVHGPDGEFLINVCALLPSGTPARLEEVFRRHPLLESRSRNWSAAFSPLSTFPVVFREPRAVSGGIMNVGDAAGFVDPFVGDGIAMALRGGNMAASCLVSHLGGESSLPEASRKYSAQYHQQLRPVYRNSSLLRRFAGLPRVLRAPLLAVAERTPTLTKHFMQATRSRTG